MMDETLTIRASGLQPGEHVKLHAELLDGRENRWTSEAEFIADEQGVVDASKQAPVKGSYKETSVMGLIWSMTPSQKNVPAYSAPSGLAPQQISFALERNGKVVSSAQLVQRQVAPGVNTINLEGQLHGALLLPDTKERRPGVLVLGGSEGGLRLDKAAWLASHGYAALALAYFHYEGLPAELKNIPLEYFLAAINWMKHRPEILPDRIAVMGTSRGGELALLLGSATPDIKAVVAYVPANFVRGGCCSESGAAYAWTWQGKPITFATPYRRFDFDNRDIQRAAIRVENTSGPILMISGESDGVWPSASMADSVVDRLKHAHFAYSYQNLKYPHAGHRAGMPQIVPKKHEEMRHAISGRMMDVGGNAEGDAHSSLDSIPKVLDFLRGSLMQTVPGHSEMPGN
jgi:dienelactone hydrolase